MDGNTKQEKEVPELDSSSLWSKAPTAGKPGGGLYAGYFFNSIDIGAVDPRKEGMC